MFKKIIIGAIIVLLIGAYFIQKDTGLDTKEQKTNFVKGMFSWVGDLFGNIKDVTSYSIKKDWLPVNETENSTED